MVLLVGVFVLKWNGVDEDPVFLEQETEMGSFSFFTRGTAKQLVTFFARQAVKRSEPGERRAIEEGDYVCHAWISSSGLAAAVVTDKDYPGRVAFSVGALVLREFRQAHPDPTWANAKADMEMTTPAVRAILQSYQQPEKADNMLRIQKELDEVKDVLHSSMEELLQRGEKIDSIIEKSNDLDSSSKQFLWRAQKTNSCCSYG